MRYLLTIALMTAASASVAQEKETFNARAVVMGIHASGQTNTFQITIDRWSSDEERAQLFEGLVENDQDGLIKALRDQEECGFMRLLNSQGPVARRSNFPSQRIKYARSFDGPDGNRRIMLAFDRPIPYWEATNRPRTYDYDLSIVVMNLDAENKGDGSMAIGVKLNLDMVNKQLEIENFSSEPVRLTNITKR